MHRYPELMIAPMRAEMTSLGAEELRTPEDVDRFVEEAGEGAALLVVNSVCGCAAGSMRPGLRAALDRVGPDARPDRVGTVFAGADLEATERAREIFAPYPPSSPFIGFFRGGTLIAALQRGEIQGRPPEEIAAAIVERLGEGSTTAPSGGS